MEEEIKNIELSPEQLDTATLLKGLLGQAMADRYVDVCRLSAGAFDLRVSAPVAAHAMREFESTLRSILEAPMDAVAQKTAEDEARIAKVCELLKQTDLDADTMQRVIKALEPQTSHKNQIRKIVSRLGHDVEGDIAKAWYVLRDSVKKAHERSFVEALTVDDDFRADLLLPFQTVVRGISVELQKQYTALVRRVDAILSMSDKVRATKIYASEIPGALPLQWHFFKGLQSNDWLPCLIERNLLGAPLAAFKEDKDTGLSIAEWPAGDYLLRMAKEPDAGTRRLVIDALKAVSSSNHSDIRRMGIEILEALPSEESGPHADTAVNWLTRDVNSLHVHQAVRLVVTWAQGNQKEAALKVARALLQIWDHGGDIANLFGHHMYEHHLPEIRNALARDSGEESLDLLLDLLEQASAIGGWGEYIHYSRQPFIEQSSPVDGVHGALAYAVTITAKEIVEKDITRMERIIRQISARSPKMFTRIAMHVLAENPGAAPALAQAYLTDPKIVGENWCEIEYAELANAWFPSLAPDSQSAILDIIQAMPNQYKDSWRIRFEEHSKRLPTEADEKKYDDAYFRDLVWNWREVLPQVLQDRLRVIESELGDPDAWKARFTELEISPLEVADFASRPVADIAAFLKTWHPGENPQRQTITALAQALRTAVTMAPTKFAENADHLVGVVPIYLRRTFEGFHNAVGDQENFLWEKVLKLIDYALSQLRAQTKSELAAEGDDKDWRWTCLAAGELLIRGLGRGAGCIDFQHTAEIQALVLKFRSGAPDVPEQEDFEDRYERDPFFAAQATLRGIAVELYVLTIFWLSKDTSSQIGSDNRSAIKNLPDLRQLMENELADKSAAGRIPRVIFGKYLTWLGYFGEEWLVSKIGDLLPIDNEPLRDATWVGHLGYDSRPASSLMEYLRPCYMKEIASLGLKSGDRQTRFENRVGEFLVKLHLGGFLSADILDTFWKIAPERLLQHCMWALGRYLKEPPDQMPDVRERGRAYWSSRLSAAKAMPDPNKFRSEVGAFGQWCQGTFDAAWLVEQLCEMLAAGFAPNHSFGVVEWLAEISPNFPDKSVEALLALLSIPHTDQWSYLMHEGPIRAILTRGLAEGMPETKKQVEQIVSILSSKAETKYTDILRATKLVVN